MTTGETAPGPRGARNPAEFVARLQLLKNWSGLTYRELSARSAALGDVLPRSTVANMLARATLPREELLAAFVRACGVDPDGQADWEAVRKELAVRGAYGAGTTEATAEPTDTATTAGPRAEPGTRAAAGEATAWAGPLEDAGPGASTPPGAEAAAHPGAGRDTHGGALADARSGAGGLPHAAAGPDTEMGAHSGAPPGAQAAAHPGAGRDTHGGALADARPGSGGLPDAAAGPDTEAGAHSGAPPGADTEVLAEAGLGAEGEALGDGGPGGGGGPLVWPGSEGRPAAGPPPREDGPGPALDPRSRLRRTLVGAVGVAALLLAAVSVIAFVREDAPTHGRAHGHAPAPAPAPELAAPAEGPVRIRVIGSGLCLGERRGSRSGQIHQRDCAGADVPLYSLKRLPGDRWRIVSDHPDYGPGCSGIPSGGRMPDAALEDSECGDPSRVERFALEPYGTPVAGYRIVPAGSATSGSCITVTGDRTAEWSRLAQAPCTPDATGQLFSFDRRA
ncbi:helix-turn-helix domain-containing protein [Streptomyces sp. NPDC127114]|uniref:helix-turn-helix domain-containing protein n=1 Tax=Streptomyces sp. NPDC127114 TaxID=3345366 RepID=UPI00362D3778